MTDAWPEVAAKLVVYGAVLASIGGQAIRWFLLPRARRRAPSAAWPAYEARIDTVALAASGIVLGGLGLRLVTHTVVAFGFAERTLLRNLLVIGLESRWGSAWRIQVGAAIVLIATALLARTWQTVGRVPCAVAVVALCAVFPLTGHAAGNVGRMGIHALHLVGAGLWIGTLAVIVTDRSPGARDCRRHLLHTFAPVAMTGAAVVAASGAIATWTYLGPFSNFWQTTYGRLLVAKVALVVGVAWLGGMNWRALHRSETPEIDPRWTMTETVLAAVVILLTAWLTETEHHV